MALQKGASGGKRVNTRSLTTAGVLAALIVVMTVVPYTGYISYGLVEITTLHIVVAIGAAMLGWKYGAFLGLVWGVTCLVRATTNPLFAPFLNPLISVVPRVAVGAVGGLAFAALKKRNCRTALAASLSAAAATLTNTVLVLSALKLFSAALAGAPLFGTIYATLIGINGVIELVAALVLTPSVILALSPRALVMGVDVGASTTKLTLVQRGRCIRSVRKPDGQPLEEAVRALGVAGVKAIMLTGVGASFVEGDLCGVPTVRVDEFTALSHGAAKISKAPNCLVVSIGTGTSFTRVTPLHAWHVGGSGVGGGMLKCLSERMLGISDMEALQALAAGGDLHNIDLQLQDVCAGTISNLSPNSTVANLAKAAPDSAAADLAAGLCTMICESIGVMAAFAVQTHLTRTIVLVGTITDWPAAKKSLADVAALHNVKFVVPEHAAYATAIGAALEYRG